MMDLDANDLLLFVSVIDAASFSQAAERTGLPKSTISRRISLLEQRLGERLLTRTTRRLTMTDFGQNILEYARRMAEESAAVTAFAQHRKVVPSGRLRVSMPPDFSELVLAPFFLQFTARYPEIKLELDLSARRVDLLVEQFDLAIRIAAQLPDDGTLIAQIGNALRSLPADLPNTAFVESTGCSSIDSHMLLFDREPCILLGHRYAKAYQQISAGKNK